MIPKVEVCFTFIREFSANSKTLTFKGENSEFKIKIEIKELDLELQFKLELDVCLFLNTRFSMTQPLLCLSQGLSLSN